jgi:thiamine-phosphate pyrophosphorylase
MQLPRFYPILDIATLRARGAAAVEAAAAILDAGARVLQYRNKTAVTRADWEEVERIAALSREAGALLVINDRADLAALIGAALHLGQEDLPPVAARRIAPELVIGFSTHNESQVRAALAEPVDYLALGPVFGTASKENPDPVVGVEVFRRLRNVADRPLVAIGGITRDNARAILEAGADSLAIIGDLYPQPFSLAALRDRAAAWLSLLR